MESGLTRLHGAPSIHSESMVGFTLPSMHREDPKVSHIVTIQTEIRDSDAIRSACHRLELPDPTLGDARLFSGTKTGWIVNLPEWRYPIVCDVSSGRIDFDNFNGRWGDQKELNRFVQRYAAEKTLIEARKKGHTVIERQLEDGSIRLTVQVGSAA